VKHRSHQSSRHDPPDGSKNPNEREITTGIAHVVKGDRVRERQRRHVAKRVQNEKRVEGAERRLHRDEIHHDAADQMQHGKQLFAGEIAVGNNAHEEGRHQRCDRGCSVSEAYLPIGEVKRLSEIRSHRDEPHPPDEILEKHHG